METVHGHSPQNQPIWERSKGSKGHYSAVEGALRAHRARNMQRELRVEQRQQQVRGAPPQDQFFPSRQAQSLHTQRGALTDLPMQPNHPAQTHVGHQPQDMAIQDLMRGQGQPEAVQAKAMASAPDPRWIDTLHQEAQFLPASEKALGMVAKDMGAQEPIMSDEIPKGSYIDYQV